MSSYTDVKNLIISNIKANGQREITGPILQDVLLNMLENSSEADAANKEYVDNKIADIPVEKGTGENSVVQKGGDNKATGKLSFAEGAYTKAYGGYSHAEGFDTTASGYNSHSEGSYSKALGNYSHAEGNNTTTSGGYSHAEGNNTTASGGYSHAEGKGSQTMNDCEHSEGKYNKSIEGKTIHTVGIGSSESDRKNAEEIHINGDKYVYGIGGYDGTNSQTEGVKTLQDVITNIPVEKGTGLNSVVQKGSGSIAIGDYSFAEGSNTQALATASHAEGEDTISTGNYSHTEGQGTETHNKGEHSEGKYNKSIEGKTIHTVGIGSWELNRKNAHEIHFDGKHYIYGIGGYDGTNSQTEGVKTIQEVVAESANAVQITYVELKSLRDAGNLVPGTQYRITDYTCTTTQDNTKSAGHVFDIIVTADDESTLNEVARAVKHEGDTYFANSDLNAWKLWYNLDNDTNRFKWAIIGELIDTIKSTGGSSSKTYTYSSPISNIVLGRVVYNLKIGVRTMIYDGPYIYVTKTDDYTLVVEDGDNWVEYTDGISVYTDSQEGKGVIYRMIDEFGNDCPYDFKNIQFKHPNDDTTYPHYYYTFASNNIEDNTDNSLSISNHCYSNTIREYISSNKRLLNCLIFIGGECYNNTFGGDCGNNTFGNSCYNNTFGNSCYNNTFGNDCDNNTFGNSCYNNTFRDYCHNNAFGNSCYNNTFGGLCYNNTFRENCSRNTFVDACNDNTFGDDCSSNTFGNNCLYNSFGENCLRNTFGDNCSSNTFGNRCNDNTFGNDCDNNAFGNICCSNTFGNECYYNTFGNSCIYIKFASDASATTKYNYYKYNHFGDGCQYIVFTGAETSSWTQQVQNYNFAQGLQGTDSAYLTIDGVRNRAYETKVAKNSNGDLKIYCEADLIL